MILFMMYEIVSNERQPCVGDRVMRSDAYLSFWYNVKKGSVPLNRSKKNPKIRKLKFCSLIGLNVKTLIQRNYE